MDVVYLVISTVSVILWMPILLQFGRSWSKRRNPVSLAICAAITLIMWTSMAGMWLITGKIAYRTLILATSSLSALVALYAHIAFWWSKRRFNDERSR